MPSDRDSLDLDPEMLFPVAVEVAPGAMLESDAEVENGIEFTVSSLNSVRETGCELDTRAYRSEVIVRADV